MDTLLTFATDERTARIALAAIAEPGDATTGYLLSSHGAIDTTTMLSDGGPVPSLDNVEARLWRKRLTRRIEPKLIREVIDRTTRDGFETLIPGDSDYPLSLDDLGDAAPYVLWVKGAKSLLTTQ